MRTDQHTDAPSASSRSDDGAEDIEVATDRPEDGPEPTPVAEADSGSADSTQDRSLEDRRAEGGPDTGPPGSGPNGPDQLLPEVSRSYWTEVPRFLRAWADHLRRWPAERAAPVDKSRDPEGSWRGDGNQYLNPEQHAEAKAVIARVQQIEKSVTADLVQVEQENTSGGQLAGLKFRLKGEDRLKEKIADLLESSSSDVALDDAIKDIPDAIRYTFRNVAENYGNGYGEIRERLQALGYEMTYCRSYWSDTQYKGINTRWITPGGQRFEVQFHTMESYHAKQDVTHRSYERLRNPLTSDQERGDLRVFQQEVASWIVVPDGAKDVPNFRREGF